MNEKVYVFIDASNIWQAQKVKGKTLDYLKLQNYINATYNCVSKIFYYTAYPKEGTRNYSLEGKHKFYVFLKKNLKFSVIKKELKTIKSGELIFEKGNMDVEITIDMISNINEYSKALLFSGDSDFLPILRYIKNKNKKIYVYSSKNNISHELRTGGSGYIDLLEVKDDIWGRILLDKKSTK